MKTRRLLHLNFIQHTAVVMALLMPSLSYAGRGGTADWGGGTGSVCRNSQRVVVSAKMLDLFEGVKRYKYDIPEIENVSFEDQAEAAINRLQFAEAQQDYQKISPEDARHNPSTYLRAVMRQFRDDPNSVPDGVSLGEPKDLGKEIVPFREAGCELEAVGYREFHERRPLLLVSHSVFAALSETHKAAFFVHEALYSYYQLTLNKRVSENRGTIDIRRLTAALFARNADMAHLLDVSRFLFVEKDRFGNPGRLFVDFSQNNSWAEFLGRVHPMALHQHKVTQDDAGNFKCIVKGLIRTSSVVADGPSLKLVLKEKDNCLSHLIVEGMQGQLTVNGRNILEVSDRAEVEIAFLQDHASYSEMKSQTRYPFESEVSESLRRKAQNNRTLGMRPEARGQSFKNKEIRK